MNWYYAKDGQQVGPIDEAELARLVGARTILGSTLVWKEGMNEWQPYQQAWEAGMPDWRLAGESMGGGTTAAVGPSAGSPGLLLENSAARDYRSLSADELVQAARVREKLSATQAISEGWRSVRENPGLLIGGFVVYMLCVMAVGFVPIVGTCLNILVSAPLMAGLMLVNLRALRGQETSIGEVFSGFSDKWPRLLGTGIITSIVPVLPFIPLFIAVVIWMISNGGLALLDGGFNRATPPGVAELIIGGALYLLAMPFAVFLSVAFSFSLILVIDRDLGVIDALKTSWRLFMTQLWSLIGMWILLALLQVAGALALCVGLLLSMPLLFATLAVAYEELAGSRVRAS